MSDGAGGGAQTELEMTKSVIKLWLFSTATGGAVSLLTPFGTVSLSLSQAVSAFAPICNPTQCPWGQKAFAAYLGPDHAAWEVNAPAG